MIQSLWNFVINPWRRKEYNIDDGDEVEIHNNRGNVKLKLTTMKMYNVVHW